MDDEHLIARLRAVEGAGDPRPAFVEELHAELAARLGLSDAAVVTRVRPSHTSRVLLVAATIALLVALGIGAVMIGSRLNLIQLPTSTLDTIRETGAVRVAVRTDHPQAVSALGSLAGFDVEFARYVSKWLGVQTHLVPTSVTAMLENSNADWQVGLPSQILTRDDLTLFATSEPYYAWPLYLVTARSSSIQAPSDLVGRPICAASGSPAELWLEGADAESSLIVREVAPPAIVRLLADDAACLDAVRGGDSAAMVATQLLLPDLVSSPDLRVVGDGPVAFEPRAMIVPRSALGEDELIGQLNRIIRSSRSDGMLADLSREWFGGQDLTVGLE